MTPTILVIDQDKVTFVRGDSERYPTIDGPRMVKGCVMPHALGSSPWREGILRAVCVGGTLISVFWWLALARRQFSEVMCWLEPSLRVRVACFIENAVYGIHFKVKCFLLCHRVSVAHFDEKAVYGSHVLVGA